LSVGANQYFIKEDFSPEEFAEKVGKIMANREAMDKSEGILISFKFPLLFKEGSGGG